MQPRCCCRCPQADVRGVKKQRSPGGNVLSDDGGARGSNNGEHGFASGGRLVASADGGLSRNVRGIAGTPTSSTPSKPSMFSKVGPLRFYELAKDPLP